MHALGELYARYSGMVQKAVLRTMPYISDADKEELVHDIFLSLLSLLENFDSRRAFRPWLYGVAMKKTQNFKRKSSIRAQLLQQRKSETDLHLVQPSADVQLEQAQLLERSLSTLPAGQQEVLFLHAVEGFKGEEIADILGIEVNTVWSRLHRARGTLLHLLENEETGRHHNGL